MDKGGRKRWSSLTKNVRLVWRFRFESWLQPSTCPFLPLSFYIIAKISLHSIHHCLNKLNMLIGCKAYVCEREGRSKDEPWHDNLHLISKKPSGSFWGVQSLWCRVVRFIERKNRKTVLCNLIGRVLLSNDQTPKYNTVFGCKWIVVGMN